jgi:hypothetical protein
LIVSGRWDNLAAGEQALGRRAFGAVCDTLMRSLDARRVIIDGWAHGCQYSGEPFNRALRSFWESAVATSSARAASGCSQRPTIAGVRRTAAVTGQGATAAT